MGKEPDETGKNHPDSTEALDSSADFPRHAAAASTESVPESGVGDTGSPDSPAPEAPVDSPPEPAPKAPRTEPEESSTEESPDYEEWPEGQEGGPIKSFLEHLEDLRWVIIKSVAAIAVAMVICLVGATKLVEVLKAPLNGALMRLGQEREMVLLKLGTDVLWQIPDAEGLGWPVTEEMIGEGGVTNKVRAYRLVPQRSGTNYVFALEPDPDAELNASSLPLKSYDPLAPFKIALSIALYGGLGLASPFVFLFVGQFVVPALKRTERKYLFQALAVGTVLFILGVVFCYFVMVKIALYAAVMFANWMSFSADEWRAGEYISFVCKFLLGMGLAFELPVVLLTLVRIRILDYRTLSKFRIYWVVIEMVFASILTPPDPATMFMMAVPLHLLYEFSVLVARYWARKER